MPNKGREGELERLSQLFLSSESKPEKAQEASYAMEQPETYGELGKERLRVEEKIQIKRELNYPDIPAAQSEIKRQVLKLLEEGYTIVSVQLKRQKQTEEFAKKVTTEENLFLGLKD